MDKSVDKSSPCIPRSAAGDALNGAAVTEAVQNEREWLFKYNAISAVTGGPVEDLEGVPLPADLYQDTPDVPKLAKR